MSAVSTPATDRWLESLRELVRQEVAARLPYSAIYDYTVTASTGATVDALPQDSARGLPPLTGIPILTGIAGASNTPAPGSRIGIGFLDANPSKPFALGVFASTGALAITFDATTINVGPKAVLVAISGGAAPLVPTPWGTGVAAALTQLGTSLAAFVTPPLTPLGAIGNALLFAVGALPPPATTKTTAT